MAGEVIGVVAVVSRADVVDGADIVSRADMMGGPGVHDYLKGNLPVSPSHVFLKNLLQCTPYKSNLKLLPCLVRVLSTANSPVFDLSGVS